MTVPQSPKNQPLHPPTPTKNTMHVIVLCKMNRRMEGRESRRSQDCTLCLGRDHWAVCEQTTQPEGAWAGAAVKSWVFHGKVDEQCTRGTDLGKHTASSSCRRPSGWPEAGPLVLSHFLEGPCQALAHVGSY